MLYKCLLVSKSRNAYIQTSTYSEIKKLNLESEKMGNLNWKKIMNQISSALQFFETQNVKPTLRTLFYNLVSQKAIPNTKTSYQCLSKQLVKARKDGTFAWDILADNVRMSYGEFKDEVFENDIVETTQETLESRLKQFNVENILNECFDMYTHRAYVSRWAKQPNVVEIWIEKDALAGTIVKWTHDYNLTVRVNKGYSSWTFIYNNARELAQLLTKHQKVTILYLGDLDPSGVDMERFLKEALQSFGLNIEQVELKRLGITAEQVEKYGLPPKPEDAETLAKLERDPRNAKYTCDYVVELDSLVAYVPTEFRELLVEAIKELWDVELYQNLRIEARDKNVEIQEILDDIREQAKEKMKKFLKEGENDDS